MHILDSSAYSKLEGDHPLVLFFHDAGTVLYIC